MAIAARMPMIRMTTRSSIRVNPPSSRERWRSRLSIELSLFDFMAPAPGARLTRRCDYPRRQSPALLHALSALCPARWHWLVGPCIDSASSNLDKCMSAWTHYHALRHGRSSGKAVPSARGGPAGPPRVLRAAVYGRLSTGSRAMVYHFSLAGQPPLPPTVHVRVITPPLLVIVNVLPL